MENQMTNRVPSILAVLLLLLVVGSARTEGKDDPWAAFRFLLGEWVGEGDGKPGAGSGSFSFAPDLDDKVLVRKNRNQIPAANGRPAVNHEDLLIVYRGTDGKRNKAIYFDNEDHVINYTVTASDDGKSLTFLSDPAPSQPRFRLTYNQEKGGTVRIKFEIALPGKTEEFKTYIEGTVRRREKKG
jgi:hypothetical protein